jgi:hypothetical protein
MRWNRGLTLYHSIGFPLRMCRQGRGNDFCQLPSCNFHKTGYRYVIGGNGRFLLNWRSAKFFICGRKIFGLSESWRWKNGGLPLKEILIVFVHDMSNFIIISRNSDVIKFYWRIYMLSVYCHVYSLTKVWFCKWNHVVVKENFRYYCCSSAHGRCVVAESKLRMCSNTMAGKILRIVYDLRKY